jgi:peptidoglycan/xylan/chitin deacetylase (PgdA/CDA1 family)
MRLFRPCFIARWLYPDAIFRIKTTEKLLYLTFDDGPDPDSTPQLLDILLKYRIKALFFCDGRAAERYPDLVRMIITYGHIIGNHSYSHPDGWLTPVKRYITDIAKSDSYTSSELFRPPYGRLTLCQYMKIKKTYKIVLWDLMSYDFDESFGSMNSLRVLNEKIRPGSIIVLHDTSHSFANRIVDEFLASSVKKGYGFDLPIDYNDPDCRKRFVR